MDENYLRRIAIRDILCLLLISLKDAVLCLDPADFLDPADDNVCPTVRLDDLSNCKAFILYSNHCDGFYDSQVCEFVHSGSVDAWIYDIAPSTLLQYSCCPGFIGAGCSKACPENTFGIGCHGKCQCQNGGTCNPYDGSCACPVGWNGPFCERTCSEGFYGDGCSQICPDCNSNSYCNHTNGQCICAPGFDGELCTKRCEGSEIGGVCLEFCYLCPNFCDPVSGFCACGPGWIGHYCTEPCDIGTFGDGCGNTCQCENDAVCLHENGNCLCKPGWKGTLCDEPCERGFYGNQCLKGCNCPNNSSCDHVSGECHCTCDWQGPRCNEVSHCKPGENCQPANGTCVADVADLFSKTTQPIKIGIAASAGATTFLILVVFAIYCMQRARVKSRTFSMEKKLPLFSNGPQPPPRPAFMTFNNEPVYDSIGEDGHYLEIIENKPTGVYNPEYHLSGGEGYLIPSQILIKSNDQDEISSSSSSRSSSSSS